MATKLLAINKATAQRTIQALVDATLLHEITGKTCDRAYAYRNYLAVLGEETQALASYAAIRMTSSAEFTARRKIKAARTLRRRGRRTSFC